jgi:U3 small nucleolar RNA-associated protein 7
MDSLFAKAAAVDGQKRKRPGGGKPGAKPARPKPDAADDRTAGSVARHTALPRTLQAAGPAADAAAGAHEHIANKKLRTRLGRESAQAARAKALVEDAELLYRDDGGLLQAEDELERTWRVAQDEIAQGAGQEAAKGRREWKLDGGSYRCRYSRNGRCASSFSFMWALLKPA